MGEQSYFKQYNLTQFRSAWNKAKGDAQVNVRKPSGGFGRPNIVSLSVALSFGGGKQRHLGTLLRDATEEDEEISGKFVLLWNVQNGFLSARFLTF